MILRTSSKILIGGGLVVTGGLLVTGAAVAGFVAGAAVAQWMNDERADKGRYSKAKPKPPGIVEYRRMDEDPERASARWPANGTSLSLERKEEINDSTPENPVTITPHEVNAMGLDYVRVNLDSGRFKLTEPMEV